ncbi:MAG: hypothetical protein EXR72_26835 [Myxococcales bacterium]|nr:hypothetical protein [Myxococcales bacterium]
MPLRGPPGALRYRASSSTALVVKLREARSTLPDGVYEVNRSGLRDVTIRRQQRGAQITFRFDRPAPAREVLLGGDELRVRLPLLP